MRAMNMKNFSAMSLIAAVLAISAGCATTEPDRDPDPEQFAAEVDRRLESDPNKRTCRTIRPTGSRLGERVCKSNYEWAKIEEESRSAIDRMQQDGNVATGGGE
jgi:hypothetical protein